MDRLACLNKRQNLQSEKKKIMNWIGNIIHLNFTNITNYNELYQMDELNNLINWTNCNKYYSSSDEIISNINENIHILDLINCKQNEIKDILIKMREIATKAADTSYNKSQRIDFQQTYDSYVKKINELQKNLKYQNQNVWKISKSCYNSSDKAAKFWYSRINFQIFKSPSLCLDTNSDFKVLLHEKNKISNKFKYEYITQDLTSLDFGNGIGKKYFNKYWGSSVDKYILHNAVEDENEELIKNNKKPKYSNECSPIPIYTLVDCPNFSTNPGLNYNGNDIPEDLVNTKIADKLTDYIDSFLEILQKKINEHKDDAEFLSNSNKDVINQKNIANKTLEELKLSAKNALQKRLCEINNEIEYLDIFIKF